MEHVKTENNNLKRERTKSSDDDKIKNDIVKLNDYNIIGGKNIKSALIVSDLPMNKNDLGDSIAVKKIPMFNKNEFTQYITIHSCNKKLTNIQLAPFLLNSEKLIIVNKTQNLIDASTNDGDKNNSVESNKIEMEALMSDKINNSINNIENKDNNQQQTTSELQIFEENDGDIMENEEDEDTLPLIIEELDENSRILVEEEEEEELKKNAHENVNDLLDNDESNNEEVDECNDDSVDQESNVSFGQKLSGLVEDDCSNVIDLTLSDSDDEDDHRTGVVFMKRLDNYFVKAGSSNDSKRNDDNDDIVVVKKEPELNNSKDKKNTGGPQDDNENDKNSKTPEDTTEATDNTLYYKIKDKFSWVFKDDGRQHTDNTNKIGEFSGKKIKKIEMKNNIQEENNIVDNNDASADDSLTESNNDKKKITILSLKSIRNNLRKKNINSVAVNENTILQKQNDENITDEQTLKLSDEKINDNSKINEKKNTDESVKLSDKNNEIEDEILSMFEEYDPDEIPVESTEEKNDKSSKNDDALVKIDLTNYKCSKIRNNRKNPTRIKANKNKSSKNVDKIYTIDLTDDEVINCSTRKVKTPKISVPKKEKKNIVKKKDNKSTIRKRKLIINHNTDDKCGNKSLEKNLSDGKENGELVEEELNDSGDEILPKKQRKFEEASSSQLSGEKNEGNSSEIVEEELDYSYDEISSPKSNKSQEKNSNKQTNKAKDNELTESESDGSFDKISPPKRKKLKKSSNFKSSNKKKSQSNEKKNSELVEEELDYSCDKIPSPKQKKSNKKNNKSQPHHQEEDEEGGTSDNNMSLLNFNYHDELDYEYDDIIESEKITKKKSQNEKRKRSTKIIEKPIPDEQLNDEDYDPNKTSTYLQLMDIFPDADEDWMKQKVESIYRSQRSITSFVTKNLEQPEYKKKFIEKSQQLKTRTKPKKLTPDILYTTEFNVKNFLKLFPRPHKYFEDPNRKCEESCLALEFLKSKFKKFSRNTIEKIYVDSKYNMSIAANVLSKTPVEFNIDIERLEFIYPDEDIEFLQESAFINYREDIKNEYKKRIQKVNKLINTHLECQCCFAQEHISKCATCEGGHTFCHSCIISGTNTYLGDGESDVYCFAGCGEQISVAVLENILDAKQFKRLMKNKEFVELMDVRIKGTTPCPFCKIGSKQSQNNKIFKCQNSDCMIESCVDCKMINHQPEPCNLTEIAKHLIENSMSQAITRECHNCQKIYIKDYGCNKITCTCGVSLCYLCNKSIRGDSHFRKEGEKVKPNETPKCPYYCDDDYLNAQTVKKVGEEVKKKLLAINPKLDIDIDHLLPSIPAPTVDGPHQLIPDNTDIADDYVQQIVQKENFFSTKINDNKST